MFFVLASVGLPGLNNFVGEFMALLGAFHSTLWFAKPFAVLAALGIVLTAIYLLYLAAKLVWGPPVIPPTYKGYSDMHEHGMDPGHPMGLSTREIITLTPLAAICLAIGLFPFPLIRSLEPSVTALVEPARQLVVSQSQTQATPELVIDDRPASILAGDDTLTGETTALPRAQVSAMREPVVLGGER